MAVLASETVSVTAGREVREIEEYDENAEALVQAAHN
jgi:hypothetical protein